MSQTIIQAHARVLHVKVYEQRVWLRRRIEVELAPGISSVHIPGLEMELDPAKVRVHAEGALVLAGEAVAPTGEDRLPTRNPNVDLYTLEARVEGARALAAFLEDLQPPEALEAFEPLAFWNAAEHILAQRAAVEADLRAAEHTLELAEGELEDVPPTRGARGTTLQLRLRAPAPVRCRLDLRSDAGWGTWRPGYQLRIDGSEVSMSAHADVWHRAHLEPSSSASLELAGGEPPEPFDPLTAGPWIVRSDRAYEERSAALYQKRNHRMREPSSPFPELEDTMPRAVPEPPPSREPDSPFPKGVEPYRLARTTVEPGAFRVPLGEIEARARVLHTLRPAVDRRAYARAEVEPQGPRTFPSGPVALFAGGVFRGQVELSDGGPEQPWSLDLGPQPGIVARREVQTELRVEGLLQREDVHVTTIAIEVHNGLDRVVDVIVEDQIPVAVDPRLRVRLVETTPHDADVEARTGRVRWRLSAEAGARIPLRLVYEVDAPHDYRLVQAIAEEP